MDENNSVEIVLREFHQPTDEAFIFSTWRNSSFYGVPRGTTEKNNAKKYFKEKSLEIKELLEHARIKIACLKDDPFTLIGYSVANHDHLEWIYVKVEYRGKGVGTLLFPKDIKTVTGNLTTIGRAILEKKNLKVERGEKDGNNNGNNSSQTRPA